MTSIRVTCASCGDLELQTADLRARSCLDDDRHQYRFTCNSCTEITVKDTEFRVIELLEASGVRVDYWELPKEMFETHHGRPITHDDLLEFHLVIEDEDAFEDAIASLRHSGR